MIEKLNLDKQAILTIINRVPLFKLLSEQDKREFVKEPPQVFRAKAGTTITHYKNLDKSLYVLVSGGANCIQVKDNSKVESQLNAGDLIGEISLFTNEPLACNVISTKDSIFLRINFNVMLHMPACIKDKIKSNIVRDLVTKVDSYREEQSKLQNEFSDSKKNYKKLKSEIEELKYLVKTIHQEYPHIQKRYDGISISLQ
jgi:CRP-like cAMP-binding protein